MSWWGERINKKRMDSSLPAHLPSAIEGRDPPHILVFDLTHDSHFPTFMHHWMQQWLRGSRDGAKLSFVVDHYVLQRHSELTSLVKEGERSVQLIELSPGEKRSRKNISSEPDRRAVAFHRLLNSRETQQFGGFYDWQLFCEYAERLRATRAVIAHCDHYLPLLGCGVHPPKKFSGIYFAPVFHQMALPDEPPEIQARRIREKFVLARTLRHPNLDTLFFLDHTVIDRLQSFPNPARATYLPEVVSLPDPDPERVSALRAESGEGRVTFLIFGHLSMRKGVAQFLAALESLTRELRSRVCLRLAGTCDPDCELVIEPCLQRLDQDHDVRILRRRGYVPDGALADLVHASDVIVTLYQHHHGPSNINRVAALAGRPVLSANTGFMAHEVQTWGLGLTVDAAQPHRIAGGITQFLRHSPQSLCNPERMRQLAALHTPERFAETFFSRLNRT